MKAGCFPNYQPILCVIPFCSKDASQASALLDWIKDLGGCNLNPALLVAANDVSEAVAKDLRGKATECFSDVELIRPERPLEDESWPRGANHLFRTAATWIWQFYPRPFWWNEPDNIPLKAHWLETLQHQYYSTGKLFMGTLGPGGTLNGVPFGPCVNGGAIYPQDVIERFKDFDFSSAEPWDIWMTPRILHATFNSPLIQHFFGEMGLAPTFQPNHTKGEPRNTFTLEQVNRHSVVFHRCKDGSLINVLRGLKNEPKHSKAYVLMGRNGDLIQLFPAFKAIYERTGTKPIVAISKDYQRLMDGISYVEPHVTPFDWWNGVRLAEQQVRATYSIEPIILQSHGDNWGVDQSKADTYGLSMWQRAGFSREEMMSLPLVFDKRNRDREQALIHNYLPHGRKAILYCFNGVSSPFVHAKEILNLLQRFSKEFALVDLSKIQAQRIYDLLGLYDAAVGLVTIDTATLHLAAASRIPYIAFTVDGWSSSTPKGNVALEVKYSKTRQSIPQIVKVLESWKTPQTGEIYHVYPQYPCNDPQTLKREAVAQKSWKLQPWKEIPAPEDKMPRLWREGEKRWQYIKDVFDYAAQGLRDADILIYTNTDICVRTDCCQQIASALRQSDCVYGFRRDFNYGFEELIPDNMIPRGNDYCGSDIYGFRVGWWRRHRDEMPDMILGGEAWDPCLRHLMDSTNRGRLTVLRNLCYHFRHNSFWERPENRYRLQMQIHCLKTADAWLRAHGIDPRSHGVIWPPP